MRTAVGLPIFRLGSMRRHMPLKSALYVLSLVALPLSGCFLKSASQPLPRPSAPAIAAEADQSVAVDVAVAQSVQLKSGSVYTGTTLPHRVVRVRSQVDGQILNVITDVGQVVRRGQTLVELNDELLATTVLQAQSEVAARQADVASLQAQVNDAQAQLQQVQLELQQAKTDADRWERLFQEGAVTQQQAEQARTQARTVAQRVQSARQQVLNRQRAVEAAQRRVSSQTAIVTQAQQRQAYSLLRSPVTGVVVDRLLEPGDLAQVGSEILQVADLSKVKVKILVSELEVGQIRLGQSATVRLDAFPKQVFTGVVSQLTPAADPVARLFPVEVTLTNPQSQITSGLLARVTFSAQQGPRIVVPETALEVSQPRRGGDNRQGGAGSQRGGLASSRAAQAEQATQREQSRTGTIFVVQGKAAIARSVELGERTDNQVEVLSGLAAGEQVVIRSSDALKDGTAVRLSLISERDPQS